MPDVLSNSLHFFISTLTELLVLFVVTASGTLLFEALRETRKLLPHLLLAVLVGTLIHGYVPTEFLANSPESSMAG